ncbi:MAG TPA: hypothetical protein VEL31_18010 [Ktedonobacteraceae bacterium]|nr:hypothetical protein [Ktedonobacteraceae bacterium]
MNDRRGYYSPNEINFIFARLDPQDVERFYQSYQLWTLQQQIAGLQTQITTLHQQIAENNERMQRSHPSAIALATLARLQSYSVTDVDLLDHMLARGEAWLDQTMQRLAYCEQFDFIRDNYTEWCQHALDGAYDWIDSMQNSSTISSPEESNLAVTYAARTNGSLDEVTEEILLQKLMSDEEAFMLESTLKRPTIPAQPQEPRSPVDTSLSTGTHSESSHTSAEQASTSEQAEDVPVQGEPAPEQLAAETPQLEQAPEPQSTESIKETSEEHAQSGESTASTQEEMIHSEFSDIPDSSHVPIVQALEVEQTEHPPAPGEFVPAEVDDAHEAPHTPLEQAAPSEQVGAEPVSPESEEPSLAADEDTLPAVEVPLPISDNTSSRREEPLLSETNSFSDQTTSQVSTQQTNGGHLHPARPRQKRGFLQRLFAVFFGR